MAFMGVLAVLRNLNKVRGNFLLAKQAMLREQPDVLVLIDYPSFNLRMATFCKKHLPNTRIVYYIPPKIWAWKTYRVHKIARLCDLILGIFPFEPDFYARYGYKCLYVGNPTMDSIRQFEPDTHSASPIIALLPGSRRSEISHCLPLMLKAARQVAASITTEKYNIVVTAAPGVEDDFYKPFLIDGEQLTRQTYQVVSEARAAIVNSGTATLETALLRCPQAAVYYVALSRYLWFLQPLIFHIPHFTLVNIIAQKEVIQELVAQRFTVQEIVSELMRLLANRQYRKQMQADYEHIRLLLGDTPAADNAAEQILSLCK
jgi:lipid-A-disaccharide synthase